MGHFIDMQNRETPHPSRLTSVSSFQHHHQPPPPPIRAPPPSPPPPPTPRATTGPRDPSADVCYSRLPSQNTSGPIVLEVASSRSLTNIQYGIHEIALIHVVLLWAYAPPNGGSGGSRSLKIRDFTSRQLSFLKELLYSKQKEGVLIFLYKSYNCSCRQVSVLQCRLLQGPHSTGKTGKMAKRKFQSEKTGNLETKKIHDSKEYCNI